MSSDKIFNSIITQLEILKSKNELCLLSKIQKHIENFDYESLNEVSCIVKDISSYIHNDSMNVIKGRRSPFPERISENIAKLCLCKIGELVIKGKTGDLNLIENKNYKFEVKCFSSTGPISFGPTCSWNELIFIDLIDYKNYMVKVYRTKLTNNCRIWNDIKISKTQSFEDQKNMKRRPRINFISLYPQIKDYTTLLYEGKIQNINN